MGLHRGIIGKNKLPQYCWQHHGLLNNTHTSIYIIPLYTSYYLYIHSITCTYTLTSPPTLRCLHTRTHTNWNTRSATYESSHTFCTRVSSYCTCITCTHTHTYTCNDPIRLTLLSYIHAYIYKHTYIQSFHTCTLITVLYILSKYDIYTHWLFKHEQPTITFN